MARTLAARPGGLRTAGIEEALATVEGIEPILVATRHLRALELLK